MACTQKGEITMRNFFFLALSLFIGVILIPTMIQGCSSVEPKIEKQEIVQSDRTVKVYIHETRKIETMELEEYIKGVVSGEMPAAFEMEALKAQAVAARSYAIARINSFGENGHSDHPGAPLCDSVHCQVWYSKDKLMELKDKNWMRDYWPRIEKAVTETQGLILTYDNKPVDQPLYHSTSGGKTENSEDVFASAVPYLKSVDSPYEQRAPYYTDNQTISKSTFVSKIKKKYKDINITTSNVESSLKLLERSEGGRILKLQVGNKILSGREIRDILGLRSANFKITIKGNEMIFNTVGYGHGVGMSQWGANGMAEQGYTFDQILKHFYSGVEVEKIR